MKGYSVEVNEVAFGKALELAERFEGKEVPANDCMVFMNTYRLFLKFDEDYARCEHEVVRLSIVEKATQILCELSRMERENYAVDKCMKKGMKKVADFDLVKIVEDAGKKIANLSACENSYLMRKSNEAVQLNRYRMERKGIEFMLSRMGIEFWYDWTNDMIQISAICVDDKKFEVKTY